MIDQEGYRFNVAAVICNSKGELLWARRIGTKNAWQFPQGGLHENETPEEALYRELDEELGLAPTDVKLLAKAHDWYRYHLPKRYRRQHSEPVCIGQKQQWFLLQLMAGDAVVNVAKATKPEFDGWKWVEYWHPVNHVILFKRAVYAKVLREFEPIVKRLITNDSR